MRLIDAEQFESDLITHHYGAEDIYIEDVFDELHMQPTVDAVERKKGKWIFEPKDAIELMFTKPKCSKCGYESADGGNFCSNCGAEMRGEANE